MRCAAREKLTTAFTGPDGQLSPQAALVVDAMAASRRPRSVLKWLSNPRGGAETLREIFGRGQLVTHQVLDQLNEITVWSLRRTLTDLNILPVRVETLAQLETRIHKVAAPLPGRNRELMLTYGTWWVLRHAHRQHERTGRFSRAQLRSAARRITTAAGLLAWADGQGLSLDRLTQGDLERWIEGCPLAREAADFLRWAYRRRFAEQLSLPHQPCSDPDIVMSDDERWALLSRCLHDATLPLEVRAAGAVILLYGIPLAKVVELTSAHLSQRPGPATDRGIPDGLRVSLDSPVIAAPPALGRLLAQLPAAPANPRSRPLIEAAEDPRDWLFPGRSALGHVNASVIAKRLKDHGIRVRPSRNAALIALAADLPASVVATLFNISISAAVRWSRRAGRDWNAYIAAEAATRATQ
ncbi:hypothetical protein OG394_21705 [Kribbella sp. NBC_01245]|uniref:hypothetical protein n=1 Tax=Kribbella sp. NBC_01245 TaxID=2903578 RepID=UPI002E2BFF03|nr:hypothetical protein [Kribbella sp. NBC_01245]